ncbi:MAG: TetR/AcrR family transcriptional regulator [Firmicutes bacterium]|nr:TetR/AcrR family transcriptional regulator [Bacillota bacterium]
METKKKIIETAVSLFAEKGTSFSISEVTKEVGIQKASFYAHFSSKENLLYEIIDKEIDNYFFEVKEENRELKTIFFSILNYYEGAETKLYFWKRLLLFPPQIFKNTLLKKIDKLSIQRLEIIKEIFKKYIDEDLIPSQNIKNSAIAFLALIHGLLSSKIIYDFRNENNEYNYIWEDYWRGIGGKNK